MSKTHISKPDLSANTDPFAALEAKMEACLSKWEQASRQLAELRERSGAHLDDGEELMGLARESQDGPEKKPMWGWMYRRNQGRINAKLLGSMERQMAVMRLTQDAQQTLQEGMQATLDSFAGVLREQQTEFKGMAARLRLLDQQIDVLKELASGVHLESLEGR